MQEGTRLAGLDKNIHYIVARTAEDNAIANKDIERHLQRIAHNFFSESGKEIATECIGLYRKSKDREYVYKFLLIAYEIEMNWRSYRSSETMLRIMANPHSFDPVDYKDILMLRNDDESWLYQKMYQLNYQKHYVYTPFYRAVREEALRLNRHTCNHCDNQGELYVELTSDYYKYREHLGLHCMRVVCSACKESGEIKQKPSSNTRREPS